MKPLDQLIIYRPLCLNEDQKQPLDIYFRWLEKPEQYEIELFHQLLLFKEQHGIDGQLFQVYLTILLVYHENPFTLALERKEPLKEGMKMLVMHDLEIIFSLFHTDFSSLSPILKEIFEHHGIHKNVLNIEIHQLLSKLCDQLAHSNNVEQFYSILYQHYTTYGVGFYGLNKAFRYDENKLIPIENVEPYTLKDLVGYESQKQRLVDNTKAFLLGEKANNVLLYGDSGTGKSTSIKALLNDYYKEGLRIVEVYKHQFQYLPTIIHTLQKRNYKFIIYMDDLSFEDFEIEYKYLKSVIEGGLEEKPNNILIYATSNRRHLIKQSWSERENVDEVNLNDAMQEKLSLVNRFGITILFTHPNKNEYLSIVDALAKKYGLDLDQDQLHQEALTWEIRNGGFSGRTAQQFIQYLKNKKALENL